MTLLTALELGSNYPENISIQSAKQQNEKYAVFCYLMRDKNIHKLMLSSEGVFDTSDEAEKHLHDLAKSCKEQYCK